MENRPTKYPHLIYRDDKKIESEFQGRRESLDKIADELKSLLSAFSLWSEEQKSVHSLLNLIRAADAEVMLLELYRDRSDIPKTVKIEKIKEVYSVPDYSHIVRAVDRFSNMPESFVLAFFDLVQGAFKRVEMGEEEKNEIVKKYSVFVQDEKGFDLYLALSHLCTSLNLINFSVSPGLYSNKINMKDLKLCFADLVQFLTKEMPLERHGDHDTRHLFQINYPAFLKIK